MIKFKGSWDGSCFASWGCWEPLKFSSLSDPFVEVESYYLIKDRWAFKTFFNCIQSAPFNDIPQFDPPPLSLSPSLPLSLSHMSPPLITLSRIAFVCRRVMVPSSNQLVMTLRNRASKQSVRLSVLGDWMPSNIRCASYGKLQWPNGVYLTQYWLVTTSHPAFMTLLCICTLLLINSSTQLDHHVIETWAILILPLLMPY